MRCSRWRLHDSDDLLAECEVQGFGALRVIGEQGEPQSSAARTSGPSSSNARTRSGWLSRGLPGCSVHEATHGRAAGPVLPSKAGKRMDRQCASWMVKRIAVTAHVNTDISPYSLRRSLCTSGLVSGVPLRDMQIAMRHADPSDPHRLRHGHRQRRPTHLPPRRELPRRHDRLSNAMHLGGADGPPLRVSASKHGDALAAGRASRRCRMSRATAARCGACPAPLIPPRAVMMAAL